MPLSQNLTPTSKRPKPSLFYTKLQKVSHSAKTTGFENHLQAKIKKPPQIRRLGN